MKEDAKQYLLAMIDERENVLKERLQKTRDEKVINEITSTLIQIDRIKQQVLRNKE